MLYAYVKNNVVERVQGSLPISFKNVSNFYLLPEAERNVYGWYTVIEDPDVPTDAEKIDSIDYDFDGSQVIEVKHIVSKTLADYKAELIELLKLVIAEKITLQYPLYEQTLAGLNMLPANYITTMKTDIQVFLDQFNQYKTAINNANNLNTLLTYKGYIDTWRNQ